MDEVQRVMASQQLCYDSNSKAAIYNLLQFINISEECQHTHCEDRRVPTGEA